ncbi:5'/3'-nucleotidase SurE [Thalassoglobus sp.]|uniref:5'/3'-nucleotidase SurE n=1 Tax=Thalassoglobus sp. TaxID=2795869 RepID=UPI003AA933F9
MKFLLTNDDGYLADGIAALKAAVGSRGECTVVAPNQAYSGCGHQVTDKSLIRVESGGPGIHIIHGTPADCSRLGLLQFAPDVDWVLSGINEGANLAGDIFMSGTAAAAREATLSGKKAIAFSQYLRKPEYMQDWERTTRWTQKVLDVLFDLPLEAGQFWNVNFPALHENEPDPEIEFCPHDTSQVDLQFEWNDEGAIYRGQFRNRGQRPKCDVEVCFSGKISVTKLALDCSVN